MHYNERVGPQVDVGVHRVVNSRTRIETAMKQAKLLSCVALFQILLLAAGAPARSDTPRTVDLRPLWKQGDAFYVEWESTGKGIWTKKGAWDTWVDTDQDRFGFILRVESIRADGTARVTMTYDRIAYARWWGDDKESGDAWDSDTDPADAPSELRAVFQPVLEETLAMEIDRAGHITDFTGVDALRRRVEQSNPDENTLSRFDSFFKLKGQSAFWEDWLGMYAFKPVARGDEWSRDVSSVISDGTVNYSLDRINTSGGQVRATVHFKGRGIPRAEDKTVETADGAQWEYGESTSVGRATFDSSLGLIVRARFERKYLMQMTGINPESGREECYRIRRTSEVAMRTLTLDEREAQKRRSAAGTADR